MEIEVQSIEELDPTKLYHIALAPDVTQEGIHRFAAAVRQLELRALITRSGVKFEYFLDMFNQMDEEAKAKLLAVLQPKFEINPLDHEQTK